MKSSVHLGYWSKHNSAWKAAQLVDFHMLFAIGLFVRFVYPHTHVFIFKQVDELYHNPILHTHIQTCLMITQNILQVEAKHGFSLQNSYNIHIQ